MKQNSDLKWHKNTEMVVKKGFQRMIREASKLKNVTKSEKSPKGGVEAFEVVDTLTGSFLMAVRPFEERPHELYRKWKVYTGN